MGSNNFDSRHSMLPPLDLGMPWMPDVVAAKMVEIHEEISPCSTSNLQRRNAIRCLAECMMTTERGDEKGSLKRSNAVRRKRANTGATELSTDTVAETEASITQVRTQEPFHLQYAVNRPQTTGSERPSRFIEHLVQDDVEPRKEAKSHAGVSKAVFRMKAGLKGMLR